MSRGELQGLTNGEAFSVQDMYHLIGALLLEFCVGFYGEFKMLEEEPVPPNLLSA